MPANDQSCQMLTSLKLRVRRQVLSREISADIAFLPRTGFSTALTVRSFRPPVTPSGPRRRCCANGAMLPVNL